MVLGGVKIESYKWNKVVVVRKFVVVEIVEVWVIVLKKEVSEMNGVEMGEVLRVYNE